MRISKLTFSILLLSLISFNINAQSNFDSPFFLNGKMNLGIGLGSVDVPADGGLSSVQYGSGFGFEVGFGYYLNNNLSLLANVGYAMQLQYNATSSSYGSNTSSSFFGRAIFRGGAQYEIITNQDAKVKGIRLGGGLLYEIPGGYSVTENNRDFASVEFDSKVGFYIDCGVPIHFTKKFKLIPYLRYNSNSTTVVSSPLSNVGEAVNASFIEIGAAMDLHL
ncbi:outer membrane beta-barrel protein [Flammeovirga sp. SJP92]|uniref:outer membrane beta-barrel protein n=1 Tax=Flammeovirga sp. SJP92 TaxID=1775430 RepID=UPI00078900E4|nr:outer membrane beta-barrel protein [Flammeovirga sp. SJP92]KXX69578.1 hypothetical protein AVL50_16035 [Flammeovirga sp. SJP92]